MSVTGPPARRASASAALRSTRSPYWGSGRVVGRWFEPDEVTVEGDTAGTLVISYELWQSYFGGDPERRRQDHPRMGRGLGPERSSVSCRRTSGSIRRWPRSKAGSRSTSRGYRAGGRRRSRASSPASTAPRPRRSSRRSPRTSRPPRRAGPMPRIGEFASSPCMKSSPRTTRTRCTCCSAPSGSCC